MADFGRDLRTIVDSAGNVDLTDAMLESTGRAVLAESLVRRQTTPRGSVIDVPNECLDVRDYLSDNLTTTDIQKIQGDIRKQLLLDQRVFQATVTATFDGPTRTLTIVEEIQSAQGPFTLTLGVQNLTVSLLTSGL